MLALRQAIGEKNTALSGPDMMALLEVAKKDGGARYTTRLKLHKGMEEPWLYQVRLKHK